MIVGGASTVFDVEVGQGANGDLQTLGADSLDGSAFWHNSGECGNRKSAAASSGVKEGNESKIFYCGLSGAVVETLIFAPEATGLGRFEDHAKEVPAVYPSKHLRSLTPHHSVKAYRNAE
jgi:hypothetical protein